MVVGVVVQVEMPEGALAGQFPPALFSITSLTQETFHQNQFLGGPVYIYQPITAVDAFDRRSSVCLVLLSVPIVNGDENEYAR